MSADFDFWTLGSPYLDTGGDGDFTMWTLGVPFLEVGDIPEPEPEVPGVPWPDDLPLPFVDSKLNVSTRGENTEMESGRVRYRRTQLLPFETIEVEWNFTYDEFEQFKSFFETDLVNGSLSVAIEIYGVLQTVAFYDATYSINRSDNLFNISATLEIKQT